MIFPMTSTFVTMTEGKKKQCLDIWETLHPCS